MSPHLREYTEATRCCAVLCCQRPANAAVYFSRQAFCTEGEAWIVRRPCGWVWGLAQLCDQKRDFAAAIKWNQVKSGSLFSVCITPPPRFGWTFSRRELEECLGTRQETETGQIPFWALGCFPHNRGELDGTGWNSMQTPQGDEAYVQESKEGCRGFRGVTENCTINDFEAIQTYPVEEHKRKQEFLFSRDSTPFMVCQAPP